jgi:two-component system OmpR family sensor kinase
MTTARPPSTGLWTAVRQLTGRIPLRTKLTSATLALVAVALVVISVAGISFLRNYLLGQADQQLTTLTEGGQVKSELDKYSNDPITEQRSGLSILWIPQGHGIQHVTDPQIVTGIGPQMSAPEPGPGDLSGLTPASSQIGHPFTTPATSGQGRWRVLAIAANEVNQDNGKRTPGVVTVSLDVTDVYRTIGRLTSIDMIVSTAILIGLAMIGVAIVRSSLRPLTEIEQTAEAIAAGDLSRRVPEHDPRTEVGRLGRSLNAMLAQVEGAFRARAQSETAARGSEEKMRQFIADASHELRTPLTTIRGFAELYRQRGGLADNQDAGGMPRADLDRIMRRLEQEASRMGVLVEDLLLLARMDQQRPLENRPVDLLTLAADAVHDARVTAPGRHIDLGVQPGAAPIVLGDEVRLRQVVGNLMSNALIHTPEGTPVEVRILPGPAPGPGVPGTVQLEIADHGNGLTPGQAAHVFERFYRADQARTREAGGTGLGLAIVSALVTAHSGAVDVRPTPGGGATFRVILPLAPGVAGPDPAETDHAADGPANDGQADDGQAGTGHAEADQAQAGQAGAGQAGAGLAAGGQG